MTHDPSITTRELFLLCLHERSHERPWYALLGPGQGEPLLDEIEKDSTPIPNVWAALFGIPKGTTYATAAQGLRDDLVPLSDQDIAHYARFFRRLGEQLSEGQTVRDLSDEDVGATWEEADQDEPSAQAEQ